MSQENVEIVRRAFEYLSSGRGSSEVLASFDPNFVMKPVETGATYGVNAFATTSRIGRAPGKNSK
jgi:ketosteroid isomerase-like protein